VTGEQDSDSIERMKATQDGFHYDRLEDRSGEIRGEVLRPESVTCYPVWCFGDYYGFSQGHS